MGIISFGKNQQTQIEKNRKRNAELEQDKDRFKYPKPGTNSYNDILSTLVPFSFGILQFPVISIDTDIHQNYVEHKYPHRDSARLESMGREPIKIKVRAVFSNTIIPALQDNWKYGDLYPNVYNKLTKLALENKTYVLTHPLLGDMPAKFISMTPALDARIRGAIFADLLFEETIDDNYLIDIVKNITNTIANSKSTAKSLDDMLPSLNPSPEDLGIHKSKDNLFDIMRKIEILINTPATFASGIISSINQVEGRTKEMINKIKLANTLSWAQANQLAYKLNADCKEMKKLAYKNKPKIAVIAEYIVEKRTVLTNLLFKLNNTYNELLELNPDIVKSSRIELGTTVKYYKKD